MAALARATTVGFMLVVSGSPQSDTSGSAGGNSGDYRRRDPAVKPEENVGAGYCR
jgi:hypothetical protein